MTPDMQNSLAIAVMQTEMEYLKSGMADLKAINAQQSLKLDKIFSMMDEARGGWRLLVMLGGAAGTAGGLIGWFLSHWKG